MAIHSAEAEGQVLALRLLEALEAGLPPDWETFHTTYRRWLTHVAAGCLTRNSKLASEFDCEEELVAAFLAQRLAAHV